MDNTHLSFLTLSSSPVRHALYSFCQLLSDNFSPFQSIHTRAIPLRYVVTLRILTLPPLDWQKDSDKLLPLCRDFLSDNMEARLIQLRTRVAFMESGEPLHGWKEIDTDTNGLPISKSLLNKGSIDGVTAREDLISFLMHFLEGGRWAGWLVPPKSKASVMLHDLICMSGECSASKSVPRKRLKRIRNTKLLMSSWCTRKIRIYSRNEVVG